MTAMTSATSRRSTYSKTRKPTNRPTRRPGISQTRSGFDQALRGNEPSAKMSMKATSSAVTMAAWIGSITSASKGMPRMASPPPKAPLPRPMRKVAAKPTA
jgi:hypothetical protein